MRTALYKLYDSAGDLLYIGISLSAINRLSSHKATKPWAEEIARVDVNWFDSRGEALTEEAKAIKAEWPRYNVVHNHRTLTEDHWFGKAVDDRTMPDQCHDFCLHDDPDDGTIYFPYAWVDGVAAYQCRNGHEWVCTWGHHASGSAPQNRLLP